MIINNEIRSHQPKQHVYEKREREREAVSGVATIESLWWQERECVVGVGVSWPKDYFQNVGKVKIHSFPMYKKMSIIRYALRLK